MSGIPNLQYKLAHIHEDRGNKEREKKETELKRKATRHCDNMGFRELRDSCGHYRGRVPR